MPSHLLTKLLSVASIAVLGASCSDPDAPIKDKDGKVIVPPGAQTSGPEIKEVAYDDLGWKNEKFTIDDQPFTGRAVKKSSDGKLEGKYDLVEGVFDGHVEEWYPNGVRSTLKMYKGGQRHGVTTYWKESGEPDRVVVYDNDVEIEEITDPEKLAKMPK